MLYLSFLEVLCYCLYYLVRHNVKMETLKEDLANWTEVEDAIIIIGKRLGIYEPDLKLGEIPKYVLWSKSKESEEVEFISQTLFNLVDLGAIESRDDQDDIEFRWNPKFNLKWNKLRTEPNKT